MKITHDWMVGEVEELGYDRTTIQYQFWCDKNVYSRPLRMTWEGVDTLLTNLLHSSFSKLSTPIRLGNKWQCDWYQEERDCIVFGMPDISYGDIHELFGGLGFCWNGNARVKKIYGVIGDVISLLPHVDKHNNVLTLGSVDKANHKMTMCSNTVELLLGHKLTKATFMGEPVFKVVKLRDVVDEKVKSKKFNAYDYVILNPLLCRTAMYDGGTHSAQVYEDCTEETEQDVEV